MDYDAAGNLAWSAAGQALAGMSCATARTAALARAGAWTEATTR